MRPISRSVNIPLDELPRRLFELPAPHVEVAIAATGKEAASALQLLADRGRLVRLEERLDYGEPEPLLRLWEPPSLLLQELGEPGNALCLACGAGREAVFLKAEGWTVTAIDWLPDALDQGRRLEATYTRSEAKIEWLLRDLNELKIESKFDLICMFLYFNQAVATKLSRWLSPTGRVLLETFSDKNRELTGKPANPDLALPTAFDPQLFPHLKAIHYQAHEERGRHTIRAELTLH